MRFKFYKTGFDITKNGCYANVELYLYNLTPTYVIDDYKYVEPALTVTIKIPRSGKMASKRSVGDYCSQLYVGDDGYQRVFYYYVTACEWKGSETLLVTLSLDTLTTFLGYAPDGAELPLSSWLSSESHITRRFKDRYKVLRAASSEAVPAVDPYEEGFATVPMVRSSILSVYPEASTRKWTLVYMTQYSSDTDVAKNPVQVFAFPSSKVNVNGESVGSVTWSFDSVESGSYYFLSYGMNEGDRLKFTRPNGDIADLTIGGTYSGNNVRAVYFKKTTGATGFDVTYWNRNGNALALPYSDYTSVTFVSCKKIYKQTDNMGGGDPNFATFDSPIAINAGEAFVAIPAFRDWYAENKTDSRLVKIRQLPYAPFKETYDSNGYMDLPSGWENSHGLLRFTGTTFGNYQIAKVDRYLPTLSKEDIVDTEPYIGRETKLLHSDFTLDKFVYDTSSWVKKLEMDVNGYIPQGDAGATVHFMVSDGMDNGLGFKFGFNQFQDSDYGEFMICDRNTDIPYYTNEYLNYIRYGKYYDEKSAGWNVASSVVSGLGSAVSTVASMAFAGASIGQAGGGIGAIGGAVVGAVVGAVTTAVSVAKTCDTARDSINAKIDACRHQASSVSGTSDVSMFSWYSGNVLNEIIYEPREDVKEMLFNYFRLYGYACDEYATPECTRRYVDYFKVDPVFSFESTSVYDWMVPWLDSFADDIRSRMQIGFRVFHLVGTTYDLTLSKENWENSLWNWANG